MVKSDGFKVRLLQSDSTAYKTMTLGSYITFPSCSFLKWILVHNSQGCVRVKWDTPWKTLTVGHGTEEISVSVNYQVSLISFQYNQTRRNMKGQEEKRVKKKKKTRCLTLIRKEEKDPLNLEKIKELRKNIAVFLNCLGWWILQIQIWGFINLKLKQSISDTTPWKQRNGILKFSIAKVVLPFLNIPLSISERPQSPV